MSRTPRITRTSSSSSRTVSSSRTAPPVSESVSGASTPFDARPRSDALRQQMDRLGVALQRFGLKPKRAALLEGAAALMGYRSSNALADAARDGAIDPPVAQLREVVVLHNGEALQILLDPVANCVFGVVQTDTPLPMAVSPYGHVLGIPAFPGAMGAQGMVAPSHGSSTMHLPTAPHPVAYDLARLPKLEVEVWLQQWTSRDDAVDVGSVWVDVRANVLDPQWSAEDLKEIVKRTRDYEDLVAGLLFFDNLPHTGPFLINELDGEEVLDLFQALFPNTGEDAWPFSIDDLTDAHLIALRASPAYISAYAQLRATATSVQHAGISDVVRNAMIDLDAEQKIVLLRQIQMEIEATRA